MIVILVCLSLIGSVAWVLPTPLQRAQAKIRQLAMAKGLKIKVGKLQGPREQGEVAPDSHLATSYGLPRAKDQNRAGGINAVKKITWEIFKAGGLNTKGLPEGWCWNRGEGALTAEQLSHLAQLIQQLPKDVYALGVTPMGAQAYWHEKATPEQLDDLEQVLKQLLLNSF
tara:strand:- start:3680 stop:4189 length:510 start_codon:yes stop_codon:yes gene_type:complete